MKLGLLRHRLDLWAKTNADSEHIFSVLYIFSALSHIAIAIAIGRLAWLAVQHGVVCAAVIYLLCPDFREDKAKIKTVTDGG